MLKVEIQLDAGASTMRVDRARCVMIINGIRKGLACPADVNIAVSLGGMRMTVEQGWALLDLGAGECCCLSVVTALRKLCLTNTHRCASTQELSALVQECPDLEKMCMYMAVRMLHTRWWRPLLVTVQNCSTCI